MSMILDGHIHISSTRTKPAPFLERLEEAGVDGGVVFSAFPKNFTPDAEPDEKRLEHVMRFCEGSPALYPFFFLDPTAPDACAQVDRAAAHGIAGFKIICTAFFPSDPRCMDTLRYISFHHKPVVFHSGILWDGINASGRYNRPVEFEPLLSVAGLRFALAHISWPWCDECIALFGKLDNAVKHAGAVGGMRIDNTPGTPKIYREDALRKTLLSGYDVLGKHYFGSDNFAEDYRVAWAGDWIALDKQIYEAIGLSKEQIDRVFSGNLQAFVAGG